MEIVLTSNGNILEKYEELLVEQSTSPQDVKVAIINPDRGCFANGHKPFFGGWWGKKFGLSPSATLSSRKSAKPAAVLPEKLADIVDYCHKTGKLWEDADFPAVDSSIFHKSHNPKPFQWRRPKDIVSNPEFISEGISRFDVIQGELGDCWLLAAVANLTMYSEIFERVVPANQSFSKEYFGIFHFKFWQYGHWVDIIIDDRLPTYNGQLVFMHSTDNKEFWSALLEKAYAKLHGSYELLKGGSTSEAMEDFTGGLAEVFLLQEKVPKNLFRILKKANDRCSLLGASIEADPEVYEAQLPNGLIKGHAYSITSVKTVHVTLPSGTSGVMELLRLRNPWGNEAEWTGPWSDSSPEWSCISKEARKDMGLVFDYDGEFWISFKDFMRNFEKLEICNLDPVAKIKFVRNVHKMRYIRKKQSGASLYKRSLSRSISSDSEYGLLAKKQWQSEVFEGAWVRGVTAGGCRNNIATFASNPQFTLTLEDGCDVDNDSTCIIALMQKHRRRVHLGFNDLLTIGFSIYKMPTNDQLHEPLDTGYCQKNVSYARCVNFSNLREVTCRFTLPKGTYVIIPCTFEPNKEGEFMLRVFSETKCSGKDVDCQTKFEAPAPVILPHTPSHKVKLLKHTPDQPKTNADALDTYFANVAGDDLEIDAWELKDLLSTAFQEDTPHVTFSEDTCKSMIAMVDFSRSGKLDMEEFKELWSMIRYWKHAFIKHDLDKSGTIDSFELRKALRSSGHQLNRRIITALVLRYSNREGHITFDNFIGCAVKLKTMIDIYHERDPRETGEAKFSMDAWIELTMYS